MREENRIGRSTDGNSVVSLIFTFFEVIRPEANKAIC